MPVDDIARAIGAWQQNPISSEAARTLHATLAQGTRAELTVASSIAGLVRPSLAPRPVTAQAPVAAPGPLPAEVASPGGPGAQPPATALSPQTNWGTNVRMDVAAGAVRLTCRADVMRALADAIAHPPADSRRKGIRAVGIAHSASRVVDTESTVAQTGGFERTPTSPGGELRSVATLVPRWYRVDTSKMVSVGSGARVREVNAALAAAKLALPMTGAYTGQTLVGALCTGTHGTGQAFGPLHSLVRSVQLVATDATGTKPVEYRIERAHGITEPVAYVKENPSVVLVQDDAAFRAVVVGLGSFGFVTSMIVDVTDAFHLSAEKTSHEWDALRALLAPVDRSGWPLYFGGYYSCGALFSPYPWPLTSRDPAGHGPRKGVITRMSKTETRPSGAADPSATSVPAFLFDIARDIANWTALAPLVGEWTIDAAASPSLSWGPSAPMLGNSGDLPQGYSAEYAFPLASYLSGVDAVLAAMLDLARRTGKMTLGPISLRFVRADDAMISMAEGTDTVFMEILTLSGVQAAPEVLAVIEEAALAHRGRPHWGQWWTLEKLPRIATEYAHFEEWKQQMQRFDPFHFFANDFVRRVQQLP